MFLTRQPKTKAITSANLSTIPVNRNQQAFLSKFMASIWNKLTNLAQLYYSLVTIGEDVSYVNISDSGIKPILEAAANETVKWVVNYEAYPKPKIIWSKDSREITNSNSKYSIKVELKKTVLEIKDVGLADSGQYLLSIQTTKKEDSRNFTLRVIGIFLIFLTFKVNSYFMYCRQAYCESYIRFTKQDNCLEWSILCWFYDHGLPELHCESFFPGMPSSKTMRKKLDQAFFRSKRICNFLLWCLCNILSLKLCLRYPTGSKIRKRRNY